MSRREKLEEMLKSDPDDVFLNYALAMAQRNDGHSSAALAQFDRVLELDPEYVAAYFQKGQILAESGATDSARDVIRKGIEVADRVNDQHAKMEMSGFLETLG